MDKIRNKQWIVQVFCAPNATICLFTYPPRSKWASPEKMIFFKVCIFCKSIAGPLSAAKTHWMVNWLQLLNELNFVWRHTEIFMHNSSQWCPRNVQLLRTTVNWCWYSRVYALFLTFHAFVLDDNPSFFYYFFFHKITKYGADGASFFPKSVSNFRTHSATLPWFSK